MERINACAVITGEFIRINEPLDAWLFYLRTDGGLKNGPDSGHYVFYSGIRYAF